jgi:hypothetical protein
MRTFGGEGGYPSPSGCQDFMRLSVLKAMYLQNKETTRGSQAEENYIQHKRKLGQN